MRRENYLSIITAKSLMLFFTSLAQCISLPADAGWWREEAKASITANFGNINLSTDKNVLGEIFDGAAKANVNGDNFKTRCENTALSRSYDVFSTGVLLRQTDSILDGRTYVNVNDYLSAAIQYGYNNNVYWLPMENKKIGGDNSTCNSIHPHAGNTKFIISLRIKKPFVGFSAINIPLASIYTGDVIGTAQSKGAAQNIILVGTVTVPQNCIINANKIIDVNFGNISSSSFKTSGNKANGVNPISRQIAIECSNISMQANLSLRIQADNSVGNVIVSDNKNVGFVIADVNNRELTPNLLSSFIPFKLDNSAKANVTIRVYPVSVFGEKPNEGVVTALAYLRVDFA